MADDTRDIDGPLSDRQRHILTRLVDGWTHAQIGEELNLSRAHVGRIICNSIVPKMRVNRPTAAIAQYGYADGLTQAASVLKQAIVSHPIDGAEEHVNHVLQSLADELMAMAKRLVP